MISIAPTKGKGEINIHDLRSGMYIIGYGFENHFPGAFLCEEDELTFEKCRSDGPRTIVSGLVAIGFVAYLIYHWGEEEESIYSGYYNKCLDGYIEIEGKKAGAWRRDLRKEFSSNHFEEESHRIAVSQGVYDFVPADLANAIKGYIDEYVNYIRHFEEGNGPTKEKSVPALESILIGDPVAKKEAIEHIRYNIITKHEGRGLGTQMALAAKYLLTNNLLPMGFDLKSLHAALCKEFELELGYKGFATAYGKYGQ